MSCIEGSDRILGIQMVGYGAVEIIQCLAIAIWMDATKKDFDSAICLDPSVAE